MKGKREEMNLSVFICINITHASCCHVSCAGLALNQARFLAVSSPNSSSEFRALCYTASGHSSTALALAHTAPVIYHIFAMC